MKHLFASIIALFLGVSSQYAYSQSNAKIDSLKKEIIILQLKSQIDSLKSASKPLSVAPVEIDNSEYEGRQDAFKKDFINLQNEVWATKSNLDLCHKKFRIGLVVEVVGISAIILGTLIAISSANIVSSGGTSGSSGSGIALGGLVNLAGVGGVIAGHFIMADSHKYIGYAGKRNTLKSSEKYVR